MIRQTCQRSTGPAATPVFRCRRSKITAQRRAMTLIELIVSAVLATLMMVALAGIVWSSARETANLQRAARSHFPVTQLACQMRADFVNARGMLIDPQGVTLHGFLGSDRSTNRPVFTPARIRYEISQLGGNLVLIRASEEAREPVWLGCRSLRIEPLALPDPESSTLPQPEAGGLPDIPSRFRVTLIGEDGQLLWREVIHHHDE